MTNTTSTPEAAEKPRGRPFQRGNPGRPRGSKNKATRLIETMALDDAPQLASTMLDLAKQGNIAALRFCLDRLWPQRTGCPMNLSLPMIKSAGDAVASLAAVTSAINDGEITAEEGSAIALVVERYIKAVEIYELLRRLDAVEAKLKKVGGRR